MNIKIKNLTLCSVVLVLPACVSGWQSTSHYDEFTDSKMCRVERGTRAERDFAKGFTGIYFTQHFYAENYDGQVRAGVRTEPSLPIGGDVQIKVGSKLYVLTAADVPLDVAPQVSVDTRAAEQAMGKAYAETLKTMSSDIQKISSPYRAFTGDKALELLRDIAHYSGEVKFRTVGVNAAVSATGTFKAGDDFTAALSSCGISL